MFMFRSRRNALVKRLWKYRVTDRRICGSGGDGDGDGNGVYYVNDDELKSVAQSMLKRLKEPQLTLLLEAIECRGVVNNNHGSCVLVPKGELKLHRRGGRHQISPHVLCARLWRWPDLRQSFELKRLAWCQTADDDLAHECCNPYHWSRLCKPESPPPPYSRCALERLKPEDRAPSEPVSVATGGTNQYGLYSSHQGTGGVTRTDWCNLAYWEMRTRVGRLFPVCKPSVNVFSDLPHGDGLSLSALAKQSIPSTTTTTTTTTNESTTAVRRVRDKIGLGLSLSKETDGVWAYNRSDHPIFVNSPTLQPAITSVKSCAFAVHKVPPGHSIKIFDYERSLYNQQRFLDDNERQQQQQQLVMDGPFDPNSVRISFAKGWGPKYSRQAITSCPCWLEVLLVPPR